MRNQSVAMNPSEFKKMIGFLNNLKHGALLNSGRIELFRFLDKHFSDKNPDLGYTLSSAQFALFQEKVMQFEQMKEVGFLSDVDDVPRKDMVNLFRKILENSNVARKELSRNIFSVKDLAVLKVDPKKLNKDSVGLGLFDPNWRPGGELVLASKILADKHSVDVVKTQKTPGVLAEERQDQHEPIRKQKPTMVVSEEVLVAADIKNDQYGDSWKERGWSSALHEALQIEIFKLGLPDDHKKAGLFKLNINPGYPFRAVEIAVEFVNLLYPENGSNKAIISALNKKIKSLPDKNVLTAYKEIEKVRKEISDGGRLSEGLGVILDAIKNSSSIWLEYIRVGMDRSISTPTGKSDDFK